MPDTPEFIVKLVANTERRRHSLLLPGYIEVGNLVVEVKGLLDTGADAVIINRKFVEKHKLPTVLLPKPLIFRNADDSENKMGKVTHRVEGIFRLNNRKLPTYWYVADIGRDDIIFGMPWIRAYNPTIEWDSGRVTFGDALLKRQEKIFKYRQTHAPPPGTLWGLPMVTTNDETVISFVSSREEDLEDEDCVPHNPDKYLEQLLRLAKQKPRYVRASTNISTEIAIAAQEGKKKKSLDELLPDFLQDHRKVFEEEASERFPPSRPYDHAIDLKDGYVPEKKENWGKIYPLAITELEELKKFLAENLRKGYIRES